MSQDSLADSRSYEGTWEKLSQVAVKGAEYDSRERQPHPKCLQGTRVTLLDQLHGLLDSREESRLIWLHGTAGVGKSAVAFSIAERMRALKVKEQGYFFATLAYQLASNFPSIREDVNRAIRDNPALLDPDKSLRDQMEELFLQPLRRLRYSRSEEHIRKAIQNKDGHPLVCEIPVNTYGAGVAATISLDEADVDNDIHIYLAHSFRELQSRHPDFPQPPRHQLARLASRAGRRFIVASTMMKFIDDGNNDPRDRLQLMLELTSDLLPGTEVYKLYDRILSTCADPKRAYMHLSVVAALADPLPISQISKLLGPGQGRDLETTLAQLRSVMDIPADSNLPVNIHHSSVRDYVSDPTNCSLPEIQPITHPHTLLAHSSFRLMMQDIPESTALLDALSGLKSHSRAMSPDDLKNLKDSLAFIVQPPEPLHILSVQNYNPGLRPWMDVPGCTPKEGEAGCPPMAGKAGYIPRAGETGCKPETGGSGCRPIVDETGCRARVDETG
ncbi:hypothetical protein EV702DRAFT_1045425 [Suillus placidus]|uniref:Nephrocystin 3-like N-terminal domain-containing protein n=1 Tax=Suillus placidus TaxID=48579 RepID=A0A9P6ZV47_9AGAM|nr:hypothetical protein EV702DRAFT_1045425 [Suillus placidus]